MTQHVAIVLIDITFSRNILFQVNDFETHGCQGQQYHFFLWPFFSFYTYIYKREHFFKYSPCCSHGIVLLILIRTC